MNCVTCNQSTSGLDSSQVDAAVQLELDWDDVFISPVGRVFSSYGLDFKVVGKQETPDYHDCNEGYSNEVYVVVESHNRFFKKSGMANSYGGIKWISGTTEVFPEERTVIIYK